ncbi:8-oxo-dGTP diphosphatase [Diatrype stigma]|uniref:8-oxo-dGTP diphosphatase n=1 Tax=Diatrype stigma TaxID=117547 RepID=A0AAN9YS05_9PEZI
MAPLNAISAAAIARLRAYKPPPFPTWDRLHVSRRAAVLVLLFADRRGDLKVVITMRAASLRSFPERGLTKGNENAAAARASPPKIKKDQIARREAWEEIGLPMDDGRLPKPFRIEPLCELPCSLARTEVVVRPCVAFLHSDDGLQREDGIGGGGGGASRPSPTVEESMMPQLDAKEVAAVFSAPFHNFLKSRDEQVPAIGGDSTRNAVDNNGGGGGGSSEAAPLPPPGEWYNGRWAQWHGEPWRVHNFFVPVNSQEVTRPRRKRSGSGSGSSSGGRDNDNDNDGGESGQKAALAGELLKEQAPQRFLVWGFTGRILVDAARVAYAEEPEFEHNAHFGDEAIIAQLEAEGRLPEKKRRPTEVGLEATREVVNETKI